MKINIIGIFLFGVFFAGKVAYAQGPETKYPWQPPDTLKIVAKAVLPNDHYAEQKLTWNKKRVLGTALMLGFGALTYYYHQKAEESYSNYLKSGSFSQMNAYFEQAEKFDQLKGAASIGLEIGFLFNVWSFF